jgi:hypothetical protein
MDWSWGSEMVPLQWSSFAVAISDLGSGNYEVSLTPIPEPVSMIFFGTGLVGVAGFMKRRKMRRKAEGKDHGSRQGRGEPQ